MRDLKMIFKKRLTCVTLFLILVLSFSIPLVYAELKLGDVNGDGEITPLDALMVFEHYLGQRELTPEQIVAGDVNGDGELTPQDASLIFDYYLMIIRKFPVEMEENIKDISKYSDKEVFLISDKNWQNVLSLVPVTTWTEEAEIHKYPTLIFHEEDTGYIKILRDMRKFDTIFEVDGEVHDPESDPFSIFTNPFTDLYLTETGETTTLTVRIRNGEDEIFIGYIKILNYPFKGFIVPENDGIIDVNDYIKPGHEKTFELTFTVEKLPEKGFDADSIIHFLQKYPTEKLTIVGDTPQELDDLLIADSPFGAGLPVDDIQRIRVNDYFSYWDEFKDVVYVEGDYKTALIASTYASLINAPLIIKDGSLDYGSVFASKDVTLVGDIECPAGSSSCTSYTSIDELQRDYVKSSDTDKILLTNPNDIEVVHKESLFPEKSIEPAYDIFSKLSLASPFLAAGRQEVLISFEGDELVCEGCVLTPFYDKTDEAAKNAKTLIDEKISSLTLQDAKYLTILSSPNMIPHQYLNYGWFTSSWDTCYYNINPVIYYSDLNYFDIDTYSNNKVYVSFIASSVVDVGKTRRQMLFRGLDVNKEICGDFSYVTNFEYEEGFFPTVKEPSLAIDNQGNIHLVFGETSEYNELFYVMSSDQGQSWSELLTIGSDYELEHDNDLVVDSSGGLHVIWTKQDGIYYLKKSGGSWSEPKRVISGSQDYPELILAPNGDLLLFWEDLRYGLEEVWFTKSNDGGDTWLPEVRISERDYRSKNPSIVIDKDNIIHIFFDSDKIKGDFMITEYDLYYATSNDFGETWTEMEILTPFNNGVNSVHPSAVVDSKSDIILVWVDDRDGNKEIYSKIYSKGIWSEDQRMTFHDQQSYSISDVKAVVDKEDNLFTFWSINIEYDLYPRYNSRKMIYYKINHEKPERIELSNKSYNLISGRIYGLTVSDVSSYIGRSLFYDEIINNIYSPDEYSILSIGHSDFACSAYQVADHTSSSGYDTTCYTDEPEHTNLCSLGKRPPFTEYEKKQLIFYNDHGSLETWVYTIGSWEIPWLDLGFAHGEACSTGTFGYMYERKQTAFSANVLRKGGIGYKGAVSPLATSPCNGYRTIQALTGKERISLGEVQSIMCEIGNSDCQGFDIFGDPVVVLKAREVEWP